MVAGPARAHPSLDLVTQIRETAAHVGGASKQLWSASEQLSGRAQEQASALEEIDRNRTAQSLADQAEQLQRLVGRFTLTGTEATERKLTPPAVRPGGGGVPARGAPSGWGPCR